MPSSSQERGRYLKCDHCGSRVRIAPGQVWVALVYGGAALRIIACDRDGAIVEQLDRQKDGRFGFSYRDLMLQGWQRDKSQEVAHA